MAPATRTVRVCLPFQMGNGSAQLAVLGEQQQRNNVGEHSVGSRKNSSSSRMRVCSDLAGVDD